MPSILGLSLGRCEPALEDAWLPGGTRAPAPALHAPHFVASGMPQPIPRPIIIFHRYHKVPVYFTLKYAGVLYSSW